MDCNDQLVLREAHAPEALLHSGHRLHLSGGGDGSLVPLSVVPDSLIGPLSNPDKEEDENYSYHEDSDVEMSDYEHFVQRNIEKKERKLELRTPPGRKGKLSAGTKKLAKKTQAIKFNSSPPKETAQELLLDMTALEDVHRSQMICQVFPLEHL